MRVAVGLSGGVDSSVAAAKLVEAGHEVVGVTMIIWPDSKCCGEEALSDAAEVAAKLGIPHHTLDLISEFTAEVVNPFVDAYSDGRTPNPCPTCNRRLKFGHMWDGINRLAGVTHLATGHYARVRWSQEVGMWQLLRGRDERKDQSYMLWQLGQEQLARLITPLGEQTKEQTRQDACRLGLHVASKPDSQDLCFTSDDLSGFLAKRLPAQERGGPIVDRSGRQLGQHPGTIHYTVGQRRGLGVAGPEPLYVLKVLPASNTLVVGPRDETFESRFWIEDISWTSIRPPKTELAAKIKLRHGSTMVAGAILPHGKRAHVVLDEPASGISPGQFAVFHAREVVLGGGTIARKEGRE